jgi:predicted transcriptional regulator
MDTVITITTALISALVGPALVEYIKHKLTNKKEDKVKTHIQQSSVINDELEEIRDKFNGDRIWICTLHNGGHYLHGKEHMQKFSMEYELCKTNISQIQLSLKSNISTSLFSKYLEKLSNHEIVVISNIETDDKLGLKLLMEASNIKSQISVGLFDIKTDKFYAFIGVDFNNEKLFTKDEIDYFRERSSRIGGFISMLMVK